MINGQTAFGGQVTTEWDDALRRHGVIAPLKDDAPADDEPAAASSSEACNDEDDAEEFERLRATLLAKLKGGECSGHFGSVMPLSRDNYMAEVNQAGEGVAVVVFLFKERHYLSAYTLVLLEKLARKYKDVKFLQIESSDCIPGYPDANLPTIFVYRDDDLLRQLVGAAALGGAQFGIDDLEWELAQAGICETTLTVNPHATPHR